MPFTKFRCFWMTLSQLSAPIRGILTDVLILLFTEFIKFCVVLLIGFGIGYFIFFFWNTNSENENSLVRNIKSERLSAGLIQDGSFSKFPFVIELPPKASAESLKKQGTRQQTKMQKLKALVTLSMRRARIN